MHCSLWNMDRASWMTICTIIGISILLVILVIGLSCCFQCATRRTRGKELLEPQYLLLIEQRLHLLRVKRWATQYLISLRTCEICSAVYNNISTQLVIKCHVCSTGITLLYKRFWCENLAPACLCDLFVPRTPNYDFRKAKKKLIFPKPITDYLKRSFN